MAEYKSLKTAFKAIESQTKKAINQKKSLIASAANKEITAARKEIVESLMNKTGLKRKTLNDRLAITRANPKDAIMEAKITPIYGKRIYMSEYPFVQDVVRGGRTAIKLLSPIYRKNMKTGFMSTDGSRMYLRTDGTQSVRAVRGRSVPRLFDELKIKEKYESSIMFRVINAIKGML